jgi:hypothetical protein
MTGSTCGRRCCARRTRSSTPTGPSSLASGGSSSRALLLLRRRTRRRPSRCSRCSCRPSPRPRRRRCSPRGSGSSSSSTTSTGAVNAKLLSSVFFFFSLFFAHICIHIPHSLLQRPEFAGQLPALCTSLLSHALGRTHEPLRDDIVLALFNVASALTPGPCKILYIYICNCLGFFLRLSQYLRPNHSRVCKMQIKNVDPPSLPELTSRLVIPAPCLLFPYYL